jgi:large subunit ribosomal protein L17
MRHALKSRRFGRPTGHRNALFRNLITELIRHEKIQTTHARAKELASQAAGIITLGRRGDLHARRQAAAVLTDKKVLAKLFDDVGPRFKQTPGGYTRITRIGVRKGDAAPMALIELTVAKAAAAAGEGARKTEKAPKPEKAPAKEKPAKKEAAAKKPAPAKKEKAAKKEKPAKKEAKKEAAKEKGKAKGKEKDKGKGKDKKKGK